MHSISPDWVIRPASMIIIAMPVPTKSVPIACSSGPVADIDADLLVLPWFEGERLDSVPGLDQATAGELARALASEEFAAKPFDLYFAPVSAGGWRPRRVALIGAGPRASFGAVLARRLATAAGLAARQRRIGRVAFVCRAAGDISSNGVVTAALAQAIAEGLTLAEFYGATYKTTDPAPAAGARPGPSSPRGRDRAWRTSWPAAGCSGSAAISPVSSPTSRAMCSRRASLPTAWRRWPARVASASRFSTRSRSRRSAWGCCSASPAAASSRRASWCSATIRRAPPAGPVLGLVGKGITFDTGGISIKPADGMERMKDDMAGGAAVAGAMRAIGLLGAPIRVIGVVPMAENMPGGKAVKPGDILTQRGRQDGRGHQHRRRGTADSRRRPLVRAQARRDASRQRRDAHRRGRRRAGQDHHGDLRNAGCVGPADQAGRETPPAIRCGRCRSSRNTVSS